MIDIVKPKKIVTPHIEAIHGHTVIELRDVKTGRRERVESDNIVTDGAESLLRSMGSAQVAIDRVESGTLSAIKPVWAYLFGGILLFDTAIPVSPTPAKYMPAGTKMLGNGSYKVSNSGTVTEMGSYNEVESSCTSNQLVQVYDFSTQQSNGEINSVCLTSFLAGYCGYGNSNSGTAHSSLASLRGGGDPMFNAGLNIDVDYALRYAFANNRIYSFGDDIAAGVTSVDLLEYAFSVEEYSSFMEYMGQTSYTMPFVEAGRTTLTIPSHSSRLVSIAFDDKLFLIPTDSIASGATFSIYIVDCTNKTVTTKTITNGSGRAILVGGDSSRTFKPVNENALFCILQGKHLGVINLTSLTVSDSGVILASDSTAYIYRFAPDLVGFGAGVYNEDFGDALWLYDTVNATF